MLAIMNYHHHFRHPGPKRLNPRCRPRPGRYHLNGCSRQPAQPNFLSYWIPNLQNSAIALVASTSSFKRILMDTPWSKSFQSAPVKEIQIVPQLNAAPVNPESHQQQLLAMAHHEVSEIDCVLASQLPASPANAANSMCSRQRGDKLVTLTSLKL